MKTKFGATTVTKKGTYKSSKPAVATVTSAGLVTAKAPGMTTISVTYNGTKQTFKVKVIASHTHAWKATTKATCRTQGKKLCQTCGATGKTAISKKHSFKVTKKATCETAGKQICTVCGIEYGKGDEKCYKEECNKKLAASTVAVTDTAVVAPGSDR